MTPDTISAAISNAISRMDDRDLAYLVTAVGYRENMASFTWFERIDVEIADEHDQAARDVWSRALHAEAARRGI